MAVYKKNATQALPPRISNGFYLTHEQCSRPSPITLYSNQWKTASG